MKKLDIESKQNVMALISPEFDIHSLNKLLNKK